MSILQKKVYKKTQPKGSFRDKTYHQEPRTRCNGSSKYTFQIQKLKKDNICKTCPQLRRFTSKYNLKRHTLSKHGGRIDIIRFGTGYMKLSTQQQNENIDRRSVCKICNITLSCFDELQHHNTLHHKKEKYQCMICLKSFNKKCSLRLHERTQHKKKEYQCTICFQKFLDIYHLARHCKIHTKVKKYRALKLRKY